MGGKSNKEGMYVYIKLIHSPVQQKLAPYCKATILQWNFKKKKKKKMGNMGLEKEILVTGYF